MSDNYTAFSAFFESLIGYKPRYVADEQLLDARIAEIEKQVRRMRRAIHAQQAKRPGRPAPQP